MPHANGSKRVRCPECSRQLTVTGGRLPAHPRADAHTFAAGAPPPQCPGSGQLVRPPAQRDALRRVERIAARNEASERELVRAVAAARGTGAPLRAIADAAHVSHPKIMEMLRAEQAS